MTATTPPVAKLAMVGLDAPDAAALGNFSAAVLGWPLVCADESYAMLSGPDHALGIGTVADYEPPRWPDDGHKQFHLDLAADDIDSAAQRCIELGPARAEPQPGATWIVLIDPAGHPFCLTGADNWE